LEILVATFYEQACPLCDTTAEYGWVDGGNRKYFECPSCGFFQISKRAESALAERHQDRKAYYASQVPLAPENHLFVIRKPDHEFRQHSDDELQSSFVNKSELQLNCA
jgi:Zn ribbon nucleic-acid-binding protein